MFLSVADLGTDRDPVSDGWFRAGSFTELFEAMIGWVDKEMPPPPGLKLVRSAED
jgi:hypothetical protein